MISDCTASQRALSIVEQTGPQPVTIGPWAADERTLRDGLEDTYRGLGRDAATREERIAWVLRANEVRNWSMT